MRLTDISSILLITIAYYATSGHSLSITSHNVQKTRLFSSNDEIMECAVADEALELKKELFQVGASYDRGYGASPRARKQALSLIESLERSFNRTMDVADGIEGATSKLRGAYRMIWTTAADVLILEASPIFATGAIYQVFDPPLITNVIDFLPRAQAILPDSLKSVIRAKVTTRATYRSPNRIGLRFEKVQVQPRQILGQEIDIFPPLGVDLPKLPGTDSKDGPGYFDVTYWDGELLIIRQNAPGGLFCLTKVASSEP